MPARAILLLLPFAVAAVPVHAGGLDSASARALVQTSEDAWKRMDIDASQVLHADDCMETDSEPGSDGKIETKTTKCRETFDGGRETLAEVKKEGGELHYDSTIGAVKMQGDKAIVSLHEVVRMTMNGHSMQMESDQDSTVELRGGKLLITAVSTTETSKVVDGKRSY